MSQYDGKVVYAISADNTEFKKDIEETKSAAVSSGKSILGVFAAIESAMSAALGKVISLGIEYNSQIETYSTSFEVMLGSAEKAADLMEKLKKNAASTPFELADLANVTELLLNYGIKAEEVTDKLNMLGDIAQGSSEKMQRIATAYGQMSSAGKVSLEDIKQMIEAGFNPLQEITESTGESMASLYDRISKGTISVDEITDAMIRSTSEGGKYFQSMEKQSQTFSGQLSTLKDNANSFLGALSSGFSEIAKNDILPELNKSLETLTKSAQSGSIKTAMDKLSAATANLVKSATSMLEKLIPKLIDGISWFISALPTLIKLAGVALKSFLAFKAVSAVINTIEKAKKTFIAIESAIAAYTVTQNLASASASALSGALGAKEIIVAALTGKIKLATAAQAIWNGAMAANPAVAVAGAIAGLVAAVGLISIALGGANEEQRKFTNECKEAKEAAEEMAKSINESDKTYKENVDSINNEYAATQALATKLLDLSKKTNKTVAEKKQMVNITKQLNELEPELNLAYDEQTDSLNMTAKSIENLIQKKKSEALANIALERWTEVQREIMENDNALKEAQDRLTTAKKLNSEAADENNQIVVAGMRLNAENVEQFGQYGEAVTTTTSEIETLKTTQEQLQEKLKSADEDLEKYTNDVVTLGEESAAYSEQATLFLGGVEITEEALEKLGLSADEATEKYENLANMTQNAFEKIQQDSAITVEKMEQNLSSNIDTVNNWSQNIGKLANTNLDTGFLQVLRDLGPKAAGTVANMVKHIEKGGSFDNLNALYKEGGIAAVEALVSSLGVSDVEVAGEQMNIDIAKGIESSDATSETITKVVTLTKETAQNAVKEADFVSVGKNIPAGIASGIEKGSYIAVSAAISLAKKTLSATKNTLKSKSPSKAFEKIGKTAPQGVAMGIKNESYVAEKESEKLAKKTLDAFRVSKIEENISSNVLQTSSINEIKTPTFNITLTGQVDMDGFNVGKIVMKNIDDVAAFTMRGN